MELIFPWVSGAGWKVWRAGVGRLSERWGPQWRPKDFNNNAVFFIIYNPCQIDRFPFGFGRHYAHHSAFEVCKNGFYKYSYIPNFRRNGHSGGEIFLYLYGC